MFVFIVHVEYEHKPFIVMVDGVRIVVRCSTVVCQMNKLSDPDDEMPRNVIINLRWNWQTWDSGQSSRAEASWQHHQSWERGVNFRRMRQSLRASQRPPHAAATGHQLHSDGEAELLVLAADCYSLHITALLVHGTDECAGSETRLPKTCLGNAPLQPRFCQSVYLVTENKQR